MPFNRITNRLDIIRDILNRKNRLIDPLQNTHIANLRSGLITIHTSSTLCELVQTSSLFKFPIYSIRSTNGSLAICALFIFDTVPQNSPSNFREFWGTVSNKILRVISFCTSIRVLVESFHIFGLWWKICCLARAPPLLKF